MHPYSGDANGIATPLRSQHGARSVGPNPNEHTGQENNALNFGAHRIDIDVPFWTEEITNHFIIEYEEELVDMVTTRNGTPLLCDAIVQKHRESALLLLEHAQSAKKFVIIGTGRCRTLDWAMDNGAELVAKFILDCVAEKRLPVEESCCILTNYLFPLMKEFPDLMKDYIKNDSFAFEYARFSVPLSLIDKNGRRPIAMTTDDQLEEFTISDSETAKEFWINECKEHADELKASTDFQVEVAAKFFCIDQHAVRICRSKAPITHRRRRLYYAWNHVLRRIWTANLPHDIFKSQAVTTLANWMFYSLYNRFVLLVFLDLFTAALFSCFAWFYGMDNDIKKHYRHADPRQMISIVTIIASCAVPSFSLLIRFSRIKIISILIKVSILCHVLGAYNLHNDDNNDSYGHVLGHPRHDDISAFLTSFECAFVWFLVVEALLPFDRTGPFVSMVKDSFKAVVPFMALGASVLFGFSFAIRVIFVYTDQKENQKNDCEAGSGTPPAAYANSSVVSMLNDHKDQCKNNDTDLDFPHTVKILFQASVRNFEEEVRRSFALFHGLMECLSVVGEQKFRSMKETCFIGIWRSVLFTIFLFVGAIICLNLLIAILSDSFDKIKHWEEEELVMCRAEIVSAAFVSVAHDIIEKESSRGTIWNKLKNLPRYCVQKASHSIHSLTSLKPRHRCKYFHYLVPIDGTRKKRNRVWDGRIEEVAKGFRKEVQEIRATVGLTESGSMRGAAKTPSLFDQTSIIEGKIKELLKQMKEIGDLLSQIQ